MVLANSFWLWGLSALAIPLIIHLLSRKEGKVIRMGSLRYLQDSNTQQFKSLRLNEIVLFILRCLLIIILVLFLCNLLWPKSTSKKWVIVEERLQNNKTTTALKDSLVTQGYELHTLSNDFTLDEKSIGHSYWSLSEYLQSKGIADALFLSTSKASAFKGERTSKGSLKWITIPVADTEHPIAAIRKSNDSITVINAQLKDGNTHYSRDNSGSLSTPSFLKVDNDSVSISANDTLQITLVSSSSFNYDKRIMKALLNVIQKNSFRVIIINEATEDAPINPTTDWLIWLSEKSLPANVKASVISFKQKNNASILQRESSSRWILTQHLNEETILKSPISTTLAQILLPEQKLNQLADMKDERTLPDEMMWASSSLTSSEGMNKTSFISLDHYLILFFLLIWITERIIAYQRNQ